MRAIIAAIVAACFVTPAFASHHPAEQSAFIDAAAVAPYPAEAKTVYRRHVARKIVRHERHQEAHSKPQPKVTPAPTVTASADPDAGLRYEEVATSIPDALVAAAATTIADAYLVATSCPGYTMSRQGTALAVARLHPTFARRLAETIKEARAKGIDACIFSAYRPPAYGVGGFGNKFESAHSYGLAVDMSGIGDPGSRTVIAFHKIAAAHGVYGVYGPYSRSEFNHFQPTRFRLVADEAPLRRTITADGPKSLDVMWKVASAIISAPGTIVASVERRPHHQRRYARHRYRHYARG